MNYSEKSGNCKVRLPWFKCFPGDYLEGTRCLTPEQRGIYFDCLCILYQTGEPLPHDDKWMSHRLHISTRLWRSIKTALVACGKLVETPEGLNNVRASVELGSRSDQPRTNSETSPKIPKSPTISTRAQAPVRLQIEEKKKEKKEKEGIEREESVSSAPPLLGFAGHFIQLSEDEVGELKTDFPKLDFPSDLKTADVFLGAVPSRDGRDMRLVRIRQYLAKRNAERVAWGRKGGGRSTGGLRAVSDRIKAESRAH